MSGFPEDIDEIIKHQGWFPGRRYEGPKHRPDGYAIFPAAEAILEEFEGLKLGTTGPGVDCARSDIEMDPFYGDGMAEVIHENNNQLGRRMRYYPLAGVHKGHMVMFVDDDGAIYLYFDSLEFYASNFKEAIINLMRGVLPKVERPGS